MEQVGKNAFQLIAYIVAVNNLTRDFTFDQRRLNLLKLFSLKAIYEMLTRFNIYMHITDEETSKHVVSAISKKGE